MGIPLTYPLINGVRYDFTSIEFGIDGLPAVFAGITEINYDHSLDGKKLRGNRPQAIGRTRGQYDCTASMTMAKAEAAVFYTALFGKGLALQGFMEVAVDVTLTYGESGLYITDLIKGCRVKKSTNSGKEGGDVTVVKIDLDPMIIFENGLPPFDPRLLFK